MAKTVRIGHASTDSASSAANEVLIGTYSASLKPTVVLRPKTKELAEKSASACEDGCNNNKIEYSQGSRNTLNTKAKEVNYNLKEIKDTCYADCSSFMTVCAIAGGAKISYTSGAPNCGNMKSVFTKSGDYTALTASAYLNSSDYLQRGDILVRENYLNGSRHTVMVLDNGSKISTTIAVEDDEPQINIAQEAFTAVKVSLIISNIGTNSADITAKLTKIKNGKESALSKSTISNYKWSYKLESLDITGTKVVKLPVNSAEHKFSLSGLLSGNSYRLSVIAAEDKSDVKFQSPNIIFTTKAKKQADKQKVELKDSLASTKRCKVFIKIKDTFKRAIIYNGQEV